MGIEVLTDKSVLTLYENIRQQVSADIRLGDRYRLLGETAKQQERRLRQEIAQSARHGDPLGVIAGAGPLSPSLTCAPAGAASPLPVRMSLSLEAIFWRPARSFASASLI